MYQLYAYGMKYQQKNKGKKVTLYLVYPKAKNFKKRLPPFHFSVGDNPLQLKAIPYDCAKELNIV
jgi:5-methylcytosine-specific restriction endonuclease McrBC regulatory subunit McrC